MRGLDLAAECRVDCDDRGLAEDEGSCGDWPMRASMLHSVNGTVFPPVPIDRRSNCDQQTSTGTGGAVSKVFGASRGE